MLVWRRKGGKVVGETEEGKDVGVEEGGREGCWRVGRKEGRELAWWREGGKISVCASDKLFYFSPHNKEERDCEANLLVAIEHKTTHFLRL